MLPSPQANLSSAQDLAPPFQWQLGQYGAAESSEEHEAAWYQMAGTGLPVYPEEQRL
jgi:hypothetical protein